MDGFLLYMNSFSYVSNSLVFDSVMCLDVLCLVVVLCSHECLDELHPWHTFPTECYQSNICLFNHIHYLVLLKPAKFNECYLSYLRHQTMRNFLLGLNNLNQTIHGTSTKIVVAHIGLLSGGLSALLLLGVLGFD